MEKNALLDAVERYIRGEMLPEEQQFFEHVRNTNPDVDQLVIEHTLFLKQFTQYGETARLKTELQTIHQQLTENGQIGEGRPAIVVTLWKKYKKTVFVAASIAGITALVISGLISLLSPKVSPDKVDYLINQMGITNHKINDIATQVKSAQPPPVFDGFGTGFLIDGKGYLITNAHVVRNAREIDVQNTLGNYHARLIRLDPQADLALLKIDDTTYHAFNGLPYGISKSDGDLGEDLFTLGYPRPEIVYNKGYLSATTGFEEDTTTFQLTIAANPGNSGTPVFNNDGEVIGVVNSSQHNAQGMVFAVRSRNIFRAVDSMKADSSLLGSDSSLVHLHVPVGSALRGIDRRQQIRRIEDYIFIVKRN
ncbi:MAG TPA: serine protease [Puia sp.]|jgi:S1-C subfamily serine protease|nr:serine protease [Puia sp.]